MNHTAIPTFFALLCLGCYKQDEYAPLALEPTEVISELRAEPDTLLANNSAITEIRAFLPVDGQEGLDVQFQTDKGQFTETGSSTATVKTKALEVNGEVRVLAVVRLRNGLSVGTINVKAALGGYEVSTTLNSANNPPNRMELLVPSLAMSNHLTNEMEMVVQLGAASGTVTPGHEASLDIRDPDSMPRGTFRVVEDESNSEGKCRFVFSIVPDTTYVGPLIVRATTIIADSLHRDSVIIHINN